MAQIRTLFLDREEHTNSNFQQLLKNKLHPSVHPPQSLAGRDLYGETVFEFFCVTFTKNPYWQISLQKSRQETLVKASGELLIYNSSYSFLSILKLFNLADTWERSCSEECFRMSQWNISQFSKNLSRKCLESFSVTLKKLRHKLTSISSRNNNFYSNSQVSSR